jgi:hypothetical protein
LRRITIASVAVTLAIGTTARPRAGGDGLGDGPWRMIVGRWIGHRFGSGQTIKILLTIIEHHLPGASGHSVSQKAVTASFSGDGFLTFRLVE